MIKYKNFLHCICTLAISLIIKPTGFIKLYQIQSFLPTSKSICVQWLPPPCHLCKIVLPWSCHSESQCVQTPTVSIWQCSKLSPTLSADSILFPCLLFCSSNVYEAEVLTCCPAPLCHMPMTPHSFRDKMMSSSRSELSELSV